MLDLPRNIESSREFLTSPGIGVRSVEKLLGEIVTRYSEPWRFHHVMDHLDDVMGYVIQNIDDIKEPRATCWSVLYHDAIYIPQAPPEINEKLSAQLHNDRLMPYLPAKELATGKKYIESTIDHNVAENDSDLENFLDGDMKILGSSEQEFELYDSNIALEYSFYPNHIYNAGRREVLNSILQRDRIYFTDNAFQRFEQPARRNLTNKITSLE